ncbi:hypothetical protein COCON_G00131220 [Conger conger]|uniref:Uncharacterized protein n=1 Tax=Conger conger TaxID=82655 RepID=A0A9Q1DEW8_CONCO|nr:hypothetical protein COCON_G00131220 [Conger conger]
MRGVSLEGEVTEASSGARQCTGRRGDNGHAITGTSASLRRDQNLQITERTTMVASYQWDTLPTHRSILL